MSNTKTNKTNKTNITDKTNKTNKLFFVCFVWFVSGFVNAPTVSSSQPSLLPRNMTLCVIVPNWGDGQPSSLVRMGLRGGEGGGGRLRRASALLQQLHEAAHTGSSGWLHRGPNSAPARGPNLRPRGDHSRGPNLLNGPLRGDQFCSTPGDHTGDQKNAQPHTSRTWHVTNLTVNHVTVISGRY